MFGKMDKKYGNKISKHKHFHTCLLGCWGVLCAKRAAYNRITSRAWAVRSALFHPEGSIKQGVVLFFLSPEGPGDGVMRLLWMSLFS